jgi:hypothetical protein
VEVGLTVRNDDEHTSTTAMSLPALPRLFAREISCG